MEYSDNADAAFVVNAAGGDSGKRSRKRKTGGRRCVAYGCGNNCLTEPKVSLHTFPNSDTDGDRHKVWLDAVKRTQDDWPGPPPRSSSTYRSCVLCSDHFEPECFKPMDLLRKAVGFKVNVQLTPDAVPTKFYVRSHDVVKTPRRVVQREVVQVRHRLDAHHKLVSHAYFRAPQLP